MSIKRQLTTLIISTVVLASFFAALKGYQNSIQEFDNVFDQELITVSQLIVNITNDSSQLPKVLNGDIAYQIIQNNTLTYRSNNAPKLPLLDLKEGLNELIFNGQRWRYYFVQQKNKKVIVAHPIENRTKSVESILFVTIAPIIITIPFLACLIYYIIWKSLLSLSTLSNQIKLKSDDDLTKIHINNPPEELSPVIDRMNNLFIRLTLAFEQEKQLTANAAHELRTPISVLTLNAHNIKSDFNSNSLSAKSIGELTKNVNRMAHVIEQMIALYRFTPEQFKGKKKPNNLQTILQEVISNNFDEIDKNHQTISLKATNIDTLGDYFALYTLFENIIRNAIKYSGTHAEIRVSLLQHEQQSMVTIEDSGKGIHESEYTQIFQRFYRLKEGTTQIKGSGLGLSIVKHIALLHNAKVQCEKSELGGLKFIVYFPLLNQQKITL